MERFRGILKQVRKKVPLTQKEMAQKLGMSETGYASWEQGLSEPNIEAIKDICKICDISADYLIGLTDDETAYWHKEYPIPTPLAARGAEGKTVYVTAQQQEAALDELHAAAKAEAENQKNKNQE